MISACVPAISMVVLASYSGGAFAADPIRGKSLFSMHCAACHASIETGAIPDVPGMDIGDALMKSDLELLNSINSGRNMMPSFQGILNNIEILDVIAYMRSLN